MSLLAILMLSACKKKWDQRDKLANQQLNVTLMQQIRANANLTIFTSLLVRTGYDKELSSSKNYTVYAPVNAAFAGVDTAFINPKTNLPDTAARRKFVANHIIRQTYLASNIQASMRVRALSNKYITLTPTTVQDANITTADQYVGNGVLNVIDKVLQPQLNIDEYIQSLVDFPVSGLTMQAAYVRSQDSTYIDTAHATVQSIDPVTNKPILVPGSGKVSLNNYYTKVGNLASEDSTYTYFILNDAAYTNEIAKVKRFFATSSDDTTTRLAAYNVLKDVVVKGKIAQANLSGVIKSVKGKVVPITPGAVVSSYPASNGMIYIVSTMNFDVKNKIDTITIRGVHPSFYARTDYASPTSSSTKTNFINFVDSIYDNNGIKKAVQGQELWINPGTGFTTGFFAGYKLSNLNTCQYKVIYHAYNDTTNYTHIPTATDPKNPNPDGSGIISEAINFGAITAAPIVAGTVTPTYIVKFPYFKVKPFNFAETEATGPTATGTNTTINVVSGRLNVVKINSVNMYVIGAVSAKANLNDVLVDYIKLIPIVN